MCTQNSVHGDGGILRRATFSGTGPSYRRNRLTIYYISLWVLPSSYSGPLGIEKRVVTWRRSSQALATNSYMYLNCQSACERHQFFYMFTFVQSQKSWLRGG